MPPATKKQKDSSIKSKTIKKNTKAQTKISFSISKQPSISQEKRTKDKEHEKVPTLEELEQLKQFDMNMKYGPFIGIRRMERFQRAKKLQLDPPKNIKIILEAYDASEVHFPSFQDYGYSHRQ